MGIKIPQFQLALLKSGFILSQLISRRILLGGQVGKHLLSLGSGDVIYNCLPMYHSSGGLIGTIPALTLGSTIAIRSKFSASNYFRDCAKYKCNVSSYNNRHA